MLAVVAVATVGGAAAVVVPLALSLVSSPLGGVERMGAQGVPPSWGASLCSFLYSSDTYNSAQQYHASYSRPAHFLQVPYAVFFLSYLKAMFESPTRLNPYK